MGSVPSVAESFEAKKTKQVDARQQQGSGRLRKFSNLGCHASARLPSLLKHIAVSPAIQKVYMKCLGRFQSFCRLFRLPLTTPLKADTALVSY